jgi:hypothetical protein
MPPFRMNRQFFVWFATWFVASQLALLVLLPIFFVILYPIDLLRLTMRPEPGGLAVYALTLAILILLYRLLRSPAIVARQRAAGHAGPHKLGFATTMIPLVILAPIMLLLPSSDTGVKAIELARLQVGPGYKFHISEVHWDTSRTTATVLAYNETEVKEVHVAW